MTTMATNKTFSLGGELEVNRIGYGAMRLTGQPGNFGPYPQWEEGKVLLRRAVELGVNFFDSARSYGPKHVDQLLSEALLQNPHRSDDAKTSPVVIATKGGIDKPAPGNIQVDGSAQTLTRQIDEALVTLNVEQIDLFQLHRVDPNTPLEASVAALKAAQDAGKVRLIGLSNVDQDQLERALAIAPIASVQNRFNQSEQSQSSLVDFTAERGIAFIPYGPLGANPMKQGAALPAQRAIAWLLQRSPNIIVIPGTTSIVHLEENMAAWELVN